MFACRAEVGFQLRTGGCRSSKMAFSKGESPATRAGFGTSRGAPRPLEARTSVCWSAQSAPSTFVARGIPCRSYHQGCEVASCFAHIGTRGFRRESCIGGFSSEGASAGHRTTSGRAGEADNTVHRTCQEAPLKRFRVGSVGPGLAFSMFEGVGRSRRTSGAPSNRGGSTDGRSCRVRLGSGGQGIAAADCGVGGSTQVFCAEPCCCVPPRAVFRRSNSGGAGTRRQTTSLRRRNSIVSPAPLGDPWETRLLQSSLSSWLQVVPRCRRCQVQHDERWQERESSAWNAGVPSWGSRPPRASVPPSTD